MNKYDTPRSVRIDDKSWAKLKKDGEAQKPKLSRAKMIVKMIWEWRQGR